MSQESLPATIEQGQNLTIIEQGEFMGHVVTAELVDLPSVEIIDEGTLSHVKWKGNVSASRLIAEKKTTKSEIQEAVNRIEEFYVPVNPDSKTRCIDGRSDPEHNEDQLGPQVPGGAPGAALAWRLGVDSDDSTRGSFLTDAVTMFDKFERFGFPLGGHRDDELGRENSIGCGAIDGMDEILGTMIDSNLVNDHKRVVRQILGSEFNRDNYMFNLGTAIEVHGHSKDYFRDRHAILDILEKRSKDTVAILTGKHEEALVVVNTVPNTTLSSNRLSETMGVQAFGYDLWRSKEMAKRFLPRNDEKPLRDRFIMARVMTTVATLMVLTDGSQRLLLRMPSEENNTLENED